MARKSVNRPSLPVIPPIIPHPPGMLTCGDVQVPKFEVHEGPCPTDAIPLFSSGERWLMFPWHEVKVAVKAGRVVSVDCDPMEVVRVRELAYKTFNEEVVDADFRCDAAHRKFWIWRRVDSPFMLDHPECA